MLIRYGTDKNGRPIKKAVVYTKNEHGISHSQIDKDALFIVRRLKDVGFSAYIVGGAVRDLLVRNTPKDFDIVTDATPSRIKRLFRNSRIIGRRFRLVHVIFGEKIFEVSTFRSIAAGSVGNDFGTIDEDVQRRDFTINALYYDPIAEQIIDYVGGVRDIKKHSLKPVIPLDRIFVEDPVRMIRAVKYAATTGAKMHYALRHKIRKSGNLLLQISPSRLTEELLKIINSGHAYDIVKACMTEEIYMYLQPMATSLMVDNSQFEEKYMKSLEALDSFVHENHDAKLGKKLVFIIRDFAESLTDWKKEIETQISANEIYARTWAACRHFVLPMNPQRTELEFAIKSVLSGLGVQFVKQKKRKKRIKQDASENNSEK